MIKYFVPTKQNSALFFCYLNWEKNIPPLPSGLMYTYSLQLKINNMINMNNNLICHGETSDSKMNN